ncbi:MAG: oligosaccharide flippase family protein [Thermoleophilia bacterium]
MASAAVALLCGLTTIIVLARVLTPRELGLGSIALVALASPGLTRWTWIRASVVFASRHPTRMVHAAALCALGSGVAAAALCLAAAPVARDQIGDGALPLVAALGPVIIVRMLGVVPTAVLERRGQRTDLAIIRAGAAVAMAVAACALAWAGAGEWSVFGGVAALVGWQSVATALRSPVRPVPWRVLGWDVRSVLRRGRRRALGGAAALAGLAVDLVVVLRAFGLAALGTYVVALTAARAGIADPLGVVRRRVADPRTEFLRSLDRVCMVALPAAAVVAVLAGDAWEAAFGGPAPTASALLAIFALQGMAAAPAAVAARTMHRPGRRGPLDGLALFQLAVLAGLVALLYPLGIEGVAAGRAVTTAIAAVAVLVLAARALEMRHRDWVGVLLRRLACAGVVAGVVAATRWAVEGWTDPATVPVVLLLAAEAALLVAAIHGLAARGGMRRPLVASRRAAPAERSSFRQGLAVSAAGFAALGVFSVLSSIVIARIYGIQVVGEAALVMAPTLVMIALSSVGEQAGLVRKLAVLRPREPAVTGLWIVTAAFSFVLTTAILIPVTAISWVVFHHAFDRPDLFAPAVVQLVGYLFITNTCWNIDMLLSSFRAAGSLFWVRTSQAVAYLAFAIVLGVNHPTVWGLVVATLAGWGVSLLHRLPHAAAYMTFRVRGEDLRLGRRELPDIIRFGIRTAPGAFFTGVGQQIGTWTLGAVSTISAVGAFDRANTLTDRFRELGYRIVEMLYPTMVERRAEGDDEGVTRSFVDSLRYTLVFMLLVGAVGGGASTGVMDLFGDGFTEGATALTLLLFATGLAIVSMVQGAAIMSLDRPMLTTWLAAARLAVIVPMVFVLAPSFGPGGAAAAVLAGQIVAAVAAQVWLVRHLPSKVSRLWTVREMVALAAATVAGFVASRFADTELGGLAGLVAGLAFGTAAYFVALVVTGGVNERDRSRLASVTRRIRERGAPAADPS